MDSQKALLGGENFWEILPRASRTGMVLVATHNGDVTLSTYAAELSGEKVRFAAAEVSSNAWLIAHPDTDLIVGTPDIGGKND